MDNAYFAGMALVACALALLIGHVTATRSDSPERAFRFASLDGLRGWSAFLVFLVHAAVWRRDAQGLVGPVEPPLAAAIVPLVVVFFMTSAFIFVTMVVFGRREMDWLRLGVSRVLRMVPLFLLMLALLLIAVAARGWVLREPMGDLLLHIGQWLSLTSFGTPDINRVAGTLSIVNGVTWTLPYEVLFYLTLPAIALLGGRRVSLRLVLTMSAIAAAYFWYCVLPGADQYALVRRLAPFVVGAMVAVLARSAAWRRYAIGRDASVVALACLVGALALPLNRHGMYSLLFPALAFAIFASGNTCFGLLTCAAARRLGDISYSVYLLHGLLLYAVLQGCVGLDKVAAMSSTAYWALILGVVPVLLTVSNLTYDWVERPAMALTHAWTRRIRLWLNSLHVDDIVTQIPAGIEPR